MDHIVPFAAGGTHEPANVQLAHRVCNSRKGARLLRADELL
jgi:5-methylcytosine-specific restriction endonuclease McrA